MITAMRMRKINMTGVFDYTEDSDDVDAYYDDGDVDNYASDEDDIMIILLLITMMTMMTRKKIADGYDDIDNAGDDANAGDFDGDDYDNANHIVINYIDDDDDGSDDEMIVMMTRTMKKI